ncbi:jacalin-related lectin 3-like isoform X1 [Solanum dulcamara]|uniref:jacalin-related lectin 3-like isoform X1 n=1 Tax=Solanum dulcamara TaxID=45834 RepID=UPI002485A430|nr:jacalin-related lectin 3-like isoform X1 [Solanum dulcamara]
MAEAATAKAISKITEQAIFLYGVDEQVRELVTELGRMRAFLKDVDSRKQKEERVKNWANDIRDLAQDAEGIVEKFAAEVKQRKGEDIACFCTILANIVKEVVARYKIGWDIGKINKRIKSLTESLRTYGVVFHGINEGETSFREVKLQSGAIGVERWGGTGGGHWNYRPKGLVKHIVVKHGLIIDSIMFKSIEENGVMESSETFGGSGGHRTTEINIDSPSEYLTGLSGTHGLYGPYLIIKSIKIHTNLSHHGPMGSVIETDTNFSFIMQGGVIVGFHGFSGLFLDAIGLYLMPASINLHS